MAVLALTLCPCSSRGEETAGYPSSEWAPSEAWSPRIAELPTRLRLAKAVKADEALPAKTSDVFSGPPIEDDGWLAEPCVGGWRPQSYFLPSLCRYGFLAPPASESHTPSSCSASNDGDAIFAPPPCDGEACEPLLKPLSINQRAQTSRYSAQDFSPDAFCDQPYNACEELGVYGNKHLDPTQRPLVELGMPLYLGGPVPPPSDACGPTNPSLPRFYLYGDYRAAAAYIDNGGESKGVLANRLNLEWDLWLTSTERFHMSTGPLQRGNNFQRVEFNDGHSEFFNELDFFDSDTDTLFFEGDLGYMIGGWTGRYAPFDLPITAGLIPLVFQNGVWMNDAIVGVATTIPARNSPGLDWSNYDVTFFAGFDQVTSPAFDEDQSAAQVVGATTFIEAKGGYFEVGYAFLDDHDVSGRSYSNVGLSYTRRYLNLVSNSMRVIVNAGQNGPTDDRTANGVLLIAENSFLSPWPYNVIPYVNVWAGFDDPQSVARAGAAGGVLFNEGILFESDNLTGYPTLDASGNDTCGAAVGLDLLSPGFRHQLILEAAVLQTFGDSATRIAPGDQYGIGLRYQVPISNATLLRFDVMHGWLVDADDITVARAEFRWKF